MSKIIKKANELRKKSWNSTKKVFRKITSTTIGKVILVAAAIWLGGAALGAWNSGIGAVDGALVAGGGAGGGAGGLAGGAAGVPASTAASNAAAAASVPAGIETVSVVGSTTPGLTVGQVAGGAGTAGAAAAATAPPAGPTAPVQNVDLSGVQGTAEQAAASAGEEASKGLISKMMNPVQKMATWAADNPIPSMMLVNGVGTALSPDAIDLAKEQAAQDEETRKRWEENLSVGNIDLGFRPNVRGLQYNNGAPVFDPVTGAISRQTRRT